VVAIGYAGFNVMQVWLQNAYSHPFGVFCGKNGGKWKVLQQLSIPGKLWL